MVISCCIKLNLLWYYILALNCLLLKIKENCQLNVKCVVIKVRIMINSSLMNVKKWCEAISLTLKV